MSSEPLRGKAPFVAQMTPSECMVACLAMVLAWHRKPIAVSRIRALLPSGPSGTSAFDAVAAAAALGLSSQALRVPIAKLPTLAPGAVLHWEGRHFVVFERALPDGIWIADPAFGRRFVPSSEVPAVFDGLAIVFAPMTASASSTERSTVRVPPGVAGHMTDVGSFGRFLLPLSLFALLTRLAAPLLMGGAIALVPGEPAELGHLGLAIAAFAVVQWGAAFVRERLRRHSQIRVERRIGGAMMDALLGAPRAFVGQRSAAALAKRFQALSSATTLFVESRLTIASDGLFVTVGLVCLLLTLPWVAGLVVVLSVAQIATMRWLGDVEERSTSAAAYGRVQLHAFESALSRRLVDDAVAREEALEARGKWSRLREKAALPDTSRTTATRETLGITAPLLFMWVAALEAILGGASLAVIVGTNCLAATLMRAVLALFRAVETLPVARTALERAEDVLEAATGESPNVDPSKPHGDSVACSMRPAH